MRRAPRLLLSLMLIGIVCGAQTLPEVLAVRNLWAWVTKERRYWTSSSDSVTGDSMLSGHFRYMVGIWNPGPGFVRGATIGFSSTYAREVLLADTWGLSRSYEVSKTDDVYAYSWTLPDIWPKTDEFIHFETGLSCKFSSGFDSSRDVTSTLLDSKSGIQEVTIRVRPLRQFSKLDVGISLEGSEYVVVKLEKKSDRPALNYISSTWISWKIEHPQIKKSYEFKVMLKLTNLVFPSEVEFVPFVEIMGYDSARAYDWPGQEWRSRSVDPDLEISNVTITAPGASGSTVDLETANTVHYLSKSNARLKTTVRLEGLPERSLVNLHLVVDGAYAPSEFTIAGSTTLYLTEGGHEIQVPRTIEDSPGVRYYCESNIVFLSRSDISSHLRAGSLSLKFGYVRQFLLRVDSWPDGNHTAKWLNSGSTVTVTASPLVVPSDVPLGLLPFSVTYRFQAWQGTITSNSPTFSLELSQPTNMTAEWLPDYSRVIITSAIVLVSASLCGLLLMVRARRKTPTSKRKPVSDVGTLLQRLEMLKASGAISESAYKKLRSEYEERRGRD